MGSGWDAGFSLTTHERQQVPVQLAPGIETFVTISLTTQGRIPGRCLPEPQSLFRVEVDILPRSKLRADVNVSGGDEGTLNFLVLGGTQVRVWIDHW